MELISVKEDHKQVNSTKWNDEFGGEEGPCLKSILSLSDPEGKETFLYLEKMDLLEWRIFWFFFFSLKYLFSYYI